MSSIAPAIRTLIYAGDPDGFGFENTTEMGRNYLAFGRNIINADGSSSPQTGPYSAQFTFGGAVNAFGFDLSGTEFTIGVDGFNVTTFSNGQIGEDFFFPSDQVFGVEFYGLITDASFDAIRINIPVIGAMGGTADYVAFDDVSWGVPTPSGVSLLALGGLVVTRRRR